MSTDQSTPAGGYPDPGELAPPLTGPAHEEVGMVAPVVVQPAPVVLDAASVVAEPVHPAGDPSADNGTGMAVARRGVLLPAESGTDGAAPGADTMAVALIRFGGQRDSTRLIDEPLPSVHEQPNAQHLVDLPVYPTLVPDVHAVAVMRRQRQGHVINREELAWVRQSWMYVFRMRTDFTSTEGPRSELRFACDHQLFDSLSGCPFSAKAPGNIQALLTAGPDVRPIRPRVLPEDIIDETVRLWNHYCGLEQRPAIRRQARILAARGVPATIARTIDVQLEAQLLVPIFVGLFSHSSGDRLVVVDGLGGSLQPGVAAAMTSDYRYLMGELDGNRPVQVGLG